MVGLDSRDTVAAYLWKIPDFAAHQVRGTGIEIVNTGVVDAAFHLGAITW